MFNQDIEDTQVFKEFSELNQIKYQRASWEEGQKHINRTSVRQRIGNNYLKYDFFCSNTVFKKYGAGVFFFFDFLLKACIVFWLIALIALPCYYSNYTGQGLSQSSTSGFYLTQLFSLANQPQIEVTIPQKSASQSEVQQIQLENEQKVADFYKEQNIRKYYIWIPDFIYTLVFFFFIVYYSRFTKKIQKEYKDYTITPSSYAIELKGLPKNLNDSRELKVFLNNLLISRNIVSQGEQAIVEVSLAKNFENTLYLYKKEEELHSKINIERKKLEIMKMKSSNRLQKLQMKLVKLQNEIDEIIKEKLCTRTGFNQYQTLKAFVIFNTLQQKKKFVELIDYYNYPSFFYRFIFCCYRKPIPDDLKFRGQYQLFVKAEVDEPSNIKWENLDMKKGSLILFFISQIIYSFLLKASQYSRKVVVLFAVVFLLAITSSILLIANIVKPQSTSQCAKNSLTFSEVEASNDNEIQNCYCYTRSIKELLSDKDLLDFCWESYSKQILISCLIIASSLTIVLINCILQLAMKKLSQYLRYQTVTRETKTSTILLFFCTFVNTAILTLLLQSDIYGFIFTKIVTNPIPQLKDLKDGKQFSPDFDREWYTIVGTNILLTILITTVSPHVINFIFFRPLKNFCQRRKAKKAVVQIEMNRLLEGPEFDLTIHYDNVLIIIFVCLLFSAGQPLLLILGAVSLTTQYLCYKFNILRVHRRPPAYDGTLNQTVITLLPWALVFHLAFGAYMYGQPLIFPKSDQEIKTEIKNKVSSAGGYEVNIFSNENETIKSRAFSSIYMFIFLCVLLFIAFSQVTIVQFGKKIYESLLKCFCRERINSNKISTLAQISQMENISYSNQKENMSKTMLTSYDIRLNERYSGFIFAINDNYLLTKSNKYVNSPQGNSENNEFKKVEIDNKNSQKISGNQSQNQILESIHIK